MAARTLSWEKAVSSSSIHYRNKQIDLQQQWKCTSICRQEKNQPNLGQTCLTPSKQKHNNYILQETTIHKTVQTIIYLLWSWKKPKEFPYSTWDCLKEDTQSVFIILFSNHATGFVKRESDNKSTTFWIHRLYVAVIAGKTKIYFQQFFFNYFLGIS